MTTAHWYNAERVHQSGSVILKDWMAQRQAGRGPQAAAGVPLSEILPGTEMFDILTGASMDAAGVPVNEQTAMAVSAVYASVGLIGGAIAALPFHLYKRLPGGRDRYDSDLWWLFNEQPWSNWTAASAWSWAAQSIALRGDGFWRIHRASAYSNTIVGFEPLHPGRVQVYRQDGETVYLVQTDQGTIAPVAPADMLHFPGIGFDGVRSLTPIRSALRSSVGIALAADQYAGAFFRNGARPDFALKTPGKLDKDQVDSLRMQWASRHAGPSNAHLPAVLQGGLDVQQLTMSAEDAQLLSTRQFQIQDVARIFGVPPHMIGYTEKTTSWGAGVEQMSIGFVRYTLRRYLDAMQQEINRKIWPRSRLYFAEFNTDALLEGDSKTQAEYLSKALGGPGSQGWMTVNEVRRLKNLPPVPGGDEMIRSGGGSAPDDSSQSDGSNDPADPTQDPNLTDPENPNAPDA